MSGNIYGYIYPPPPLPPPVSTTSGYTVQQWNDWSSSQINSGLPTFVQDYSRPPPPYRGNHANNHGNSRSSGFHNNTQSPRYYASRTRYNNQFDMVQQQMWQKNQKKFKRPRLEASDVSEPKSKSAKKKKKPLSQNVPSKKDWTQEDAERALNIEKEYNKRFKNHSLIIKFPDMELNKDIVSKFHPAIKNVHFQQPSTSRYCFVTLKQSSDADTVISALNHQKFGDGFLSAEFKKERDEDQVILPGDIDPLTLYVGNLAQDVTKDDIKTMYPKCKRIDIGYAMKMKFTRYAFVGFKYADDCIEAFKRTHSTEMYSKSLIVRFRRIHGTVGMPGDAKTPNPPKDSSESIRFASTGECDSGLQNTTNGLTVDTTKFDLTRSLNESQKFPVNIDSVKREPECDDETEHKPMVKFVSLLEPGDLDNAWSQVRPQLNKQVKVEVEVENDKGETNSNNVVNSHINVNLKQELPIKEEPETESDYNEEEYYGYDVDYQESEYQNDEDYDDDDGEVPVDQDFNTSLNNMLSRHNVVNSLKDFGLYR